MFLNMKNKCENICIVLFYPFTLWHNRSSKNNLKFRIMGQLMERLKKQLKDPEHKKDAEDCIEIYNWIAATDKEGRVWNSRLDPLVRVRFKGYPSDDRTYSPTITGEMVLKGIRSTC